MIRVAEKALADQPDLTNLTIMNHAPRYDTALVDPVWLKPIMFNFANSYLLDLWLDSPMKDEIFIVTIRIALGMWGQWGIRTNTLADMMGFISMVVLGRLPTQRVYWIFSCPLYKQRQIVQTKHPMTRIPTAPRPNIPKVRSCTAQLWPENHMSRHRTNSPHFWETVKG